MLTLSQLQAVMPRLPPKTATDYLQPLNAAMEEFGISTPARVAAFLAQLAHESGELRWWEEWPHKKPVSGCIQCKRISLARDIAGDAPFAGHPAGEQYENRRDLGNNQPGDGVRFKGRGPIQLTGRANYYAASRALFPRGPLLTTYLEAEPDRVLDPEVGFRVAGWFWATHPSKTGPLNEIADVVADRMTAQEQRVARAYFDDITRAINGGLNGAAQRWAYYLRAREVLGAEAP